MTGRTNKPHNLSKRRAEAKAAAKFASVVDSDTVTVPGHDSKQYRVRIWRKGRNGDGEQVVNLRCHNLHTGETCKGMRYSRHTVCYHGLASVIKLAEVKDAQASFCADDDRAETLARLGGTVVRLENGSNGQGHQSVVVSRNKPEPAAEPTPESVSTPEDAPDWHWKDAAARSKTTMSSAAVLARLYWEG